MQMNRRTIMGLAVAAAVVPAAPAVTARDGLVLSSYPDMPGYDRWIATLAQGQVVKVYLDGVEQSDVDFADERAGVIRRCKLDAEGRIYVEGDEIARETVAGHVRIEIVPAKRSA